MNATTTNIALAPCVPANLEPSAPVVSAESKPLHRKVGKLPKPLRDLINSMLDDAASAHEVVQRLRQSTDPSLPYPITQLDIYRWKHSGYLRYLAREERIACVQFNLEEANDLTVGDTSTIPEATLQLMASRCFEFFGEFDHQKLKEQLSNDPLAFTRYVNAFSRISREIMDIKKYRDACTQARAELKKLYDPGRKLTDSETRAIVHHVDQILGIKPLTPDSTPAAPSTEG